MRWIVPVFGRPKTNEATARCGTKTAEDMIRSSPPSCSLPATTRQKVMRSGRGRGAGPNRRRKWSRIGSRIGGEIGWSLSIKFRVY